MIIYGRPFRARKFLFRYGFVFAFGVFLMAHVAPQIFAYALGW